MSLNTASGETLEALQLRECTATIHIAFLHIPHYCLPNINMGLHRETLMEIKGELIKIMLSDIIARSTFL